MAVQTVTTVFKSVDGTTGTVKKIKNNIDEYGNVTKRITTTTKKLDDGIKKTTQTTDKFAKASKEKFNRMANSFERQRESIKDTSKAYPEMANQFNRNSKKVATGMDQLDGRTRALTRASAMYGKTGGQINSAMQTQGVFLDKNGQAFDSMTGRVRNTDKAMKRAAGSVKMFKMELLGTLFFGMMIQQMFMGISKTATDSFMKITEGQTQAGQAITSLSAAFQFLQFSIGDALGTALLPYLDTIVGIIESMADWIEQNPQLTAGLITAGIALGTFLLAWGALGLGLTSTLQAFPFVTGGLSALSTALGITAGSASAAAVSIGLVVLPLLLAAATIAFLWFSWQNNWFNIRQFTGGVVKGIANVFFVLVKAGQAVLTGWMLIWNGLLWVAERAAQPIIDSLNAVGGAIAFLRGEAFKPIKLDLSGISADIQGINNEINKWERSIGQGIFSFGENIALEGERFNRGMGVGPGEMPTPFGPSGGGASGGVTIGEMIINVAGGDTIKDSVEAGASEGVNEAYSNMGGTTQIGGGTG